ncbi:MAG TPA: ferric reductase-like transmembrane domain-containing protein [Candidatus Saccharimonadales bacterium]
MVKKIIQTAFLLIFLLSAGGAPLAAAAPGATADRRPVLTLEASAGSSGLKQALNKTKLGWPWYVTRASGLVAAALLVILIIFGIGLITGYTYKLMEPVSAWAVHRALGIALGVSILIHVLVLLFDKYTPFSILQVLVPFTSHYRPAIIWGVHLGSLYVAFGVLAFYAAAIVIVSSLVWVDKKPLTWRLLHYTGYLLAVLVFLHGLYLGTDLKQGFFRVLWLAGGIAIIVGIIFRLRRARTINIDEQ